MENKKKAGFKFHPRALWLCGVLARWDRQRARYWFWCVRWKRGHERLNPGSPSKKNSYASMITWDPKVRNLLEGHELTTSLYFHVKRQNHLDHNVENSRAEIYNIHHHKRSCVWLSAHLPEAETGKETRKSWWLNLENSIEDSVKVIHSESLDFISSER